MRQDIAEKWVEALRSGEYIQGNGRLKDEVRDGHTEHCCLGVLCEIYAEEHDSVWKYDPETSRLQFWPANEFGVDAETEYLPADVIKWAGMSSHNGSIGISTNNLDKVDSNLAGYNDVGKDFEYIADIIEANWENL